MTRAATRARGRARSAPGGAASGRAESAAASGRAGRGAASGGVWRAVGRGRTGRGAASGGVWRACGAVAAVALVVLVGRSLAYALVPSDLSGALGGPALPAIVLVSAVLGLGGACAVLWLAALGVRERAALAHARAPRLPLRAFAVDAAVIFAGAALVFAALESYLHWRAGLGFHGLHCLAGPVHRDALPILAALALIAAALLVAVRHVLAWMRRTLATLRRAQSKPRRVRLRPRDERALGLIRALHRGA